MSRALMFQSDVRNVITNVHYRIKSDMLIYIASLAY